MAAIRQRRCADGYGVKSLRLMRAAKERGMHLRADGSIVLPTGKSHQSTPQWGRRRVNLSIDGEKASVQVARIVCFLAHGEPPTASCVADHINGDTLNDHPSNLRWATYSENTRNAHYSRNKTWEQKAIEACAGIENFPEHGLKAQLLDSAIAWQEAINQRDELAQALRDVIGWVPGQSSWHTNEPIKAVERARALLAKAAP